MGLKERDHYRGQARRPENEHVVEGEYIRKEEYEAGSYRAPTGHERSYDQASRRSGTKSRLATWLAGGLVAIALALGARALIEKLSAPRVDAPGTLSPTPPSIPAQARTTPLPPPAARPLNPPSPPATRPSSLRRTLQQCMEPGSNEINNKTVACMNGQ